MTTLGPVSKLPPRKPCFAVFTGSRQVRNALYEHLNEPVQVTEYHNGKGTELVVTMTGRASKFPIAAFVGTWQVIELEDA
ncbi:MAG: hypothetical protein ACTS5I_13180 [Rhodanobacter sp.]